jgi:NAD(P)-dependent dehydrogenase (short-subunit alcohol dehydrogenase family)
MTSNPSLSGRRVVITGAGRGLGRALAVSATDQGADVVLLGRDPAALRRVAETVGQRTGREALSVHCDLAVPASIEEACRIVLSANPTIDVLINNGASWLPGDFAQLEDAEITSTIAATVTGTILLTKGLLPGLRHSRGADIVTIVSTVGWPGWDFGGASVAFHAAKHGQSGFSDALRRELKNEGIRVTAIYPPDFDDVDPLDPNWGKPSASRITNREVVETVLFVLSAPRACAYPVIFLDNMPLRVDT